MAATDQTYRNQRRLDLVFGVSCVLMLASVVWMFAQDYYRDFKVEQRQFRDVETALAERAMLTLLPDDDRVQKINAAEEELAAAMTDRNKREAELQGQTKKILTSKVKAEAAAQSLKADYDSQVSLYNIEVEKRNAADPNGSEYRRLQGRVEDKFAIVKDLEHKLAAALLEVDRVTAEYNKINAELKGVVDRTVKAEDELKKLMADFDRFAKLTAQKRWGAGDWFRQLPVIDAFASPTRIQQFTLDALPIDYNFKYVTRYDRCTTCHQGIDRASYGTEAIRDLTRQPPDDLQNRLKNARDIIAHRRQVLNMAEFAYSESDLPKAVRRVPLSEARVREFAAHPRLDLFVEGNSRHPAEKFGCTICHSGQGSSTDFFNASHTPNNAEQKEQWVKHEGWASNHFWDFPMFPKRFIESSCLKCHHQVLDLLPEGDKVEYRTITKKDKDGNENKVVEKIVAPGAKVVRGYNLVRELGCFGCHEISGVKDNRWVGPDLRLEPNPPLDALTPAERAKATADPLNPPGTMRRVGPSLRRITEKTNEEWVRKWVSDPRGFRPDTKMPHFFHLSNNNKEVLAQTGAIDPKNSQDNFPEATIHAIAYYLFRASRHALAQEGKKLPEPNVPAGYKEDAQRGRQLFTEKGCLACHQHEGTRAPAGNLPAVVNEAQFGPNLSRIAAKLGATPGDKASARRWLVQWIKDPKQYHPRTFMPVTHLDDRDASDVAAWLLSQKADWQAADVADPKGDAYERLARVFLNKQMSKLEADELFEAGPSAEKIQNVLDPLDKPLAEGLDAAGKLKIYIGRKSINQFGCFGCHDIPGFEAAKPIGTPLNDWGKKDPERIAFEDVTAYVKTHSYPTDGKVNEEGHGFAPKDGKEPYEKFFLEALEHHTREGFLHQKLREPRSYDYDRMKAWDDRLRMPQFKFFHGEVKPKEGESPEQAAQREEAEAREAVMTFILGLLAEPVPGQYVYEPTGDRLAQVKGQHVLDKFNCAGCHQLRAGIYDFSTAARVVDGEKKRPVLENLESFYGNIKNAGSSKSDHSFLDHNAWVGQLSPNPDRVTAHAIPISKEEGDAVRIRLTQALRFNKAEDIDLPAAERQKKALDLPAAESIELPAGDLLFKADPAGGVFTELMVPYLVSRKADKLDDDPKARSGLPPPLLREGEKVQPSWLFQFLRNPYPIRTVTILRMPRFNMSDDEAQTLVNYFAAVDHANNQGIGLHYPYLKIAQRDEGFWDEQARHYLDRLKQRKLVDERAAKMRPLWDRVLQERVVALNDELKDADKAVAAAKDAEAKKKATKDRDELKAQLQKLTAQQKQKDGDFIKQLRGQWEKDGAYAADAYRLLVNADICLKCHQVGSWGQEPIGPRLDAAGERLRPEWLQRWIASPQRLLVFPVGFHPMPQNFPADKTDYQGMFAGSSREQATAVSDILMSLPKIANMPEDRYYRPTQGAAQ
jgi:cytochrome c2